MKKQLNNIEELISTLETYITSDSELSINVIKDEIEEIIPEKVDIITDIELKYEEFFKTLTEEQVEKFNNFEYIIKINPDISTRKLLKKANITEDEYKIFLEFCNYILTSCQDDVIEEDNPIEDQIKLRTFIKFQQLAKDLSDDEIIKYEEYIDFVETKPNATKEKIIKKLDITKEQYKIFKDIYTEVDKYMKELLVETYNKQDEITSKIMDKYEEFFETLPDEEVARFKIFEEQYQVDDVKIKLIDDETTKFLNFKKELEEYSSNLISEYNDLEGDNTDLYPFITKLTTTVNKTENSVDYANFNPSEYFSCKLNDCNEKLNIILTSNGETKQFEISKDENKINFIKNE